MREMKRKMNLCQERDGEEADWREVRKPQERKRAKNKEMDTEWEKERQETE